VVHGAHPLRAVLGEVIVRRNEVHPTASQRVQVEGQGGHQGLALAGLHLGDASLVQHDPADELNVKVPEADRPHGGLPHGRKGLREDVVQYGALLLVQLGAGALQRIPPGGPLVRVHLGREFVRQGGDALPRLGSGLGEEVAEGTRQGAQAGVIAGLHLGLQGVDPVDQGLQLLDFPRLRVTKQPGYELLQHGRAVLQAQVVDVL